ncbi:MAG TPA: SGNH/GDSL hydrolase family protein [Burkholderiales bacterium]|nr:SGNH/GDSL hydrolase family protein [Burkholderiales bacterium]
MCLAFRLLYALAALVLGVCCVRPVHALPYSALYVFGDSLSDVGNDLIITDGALPAQGVYTDGISTGRFTNGQNYIDRLASSLGVSAAPSLAGGNNYAYGGARTTYVTPGLVPFGGLSFNQQITAYTSTHAAADPNAVYVLWIGANDMADAIRAAAANPANANSIIGAAITSAMSGIGSAIGNLSSRGVQHFLVPNLPDLSRIPLIAGFNNNLLTGLAHNASVAFNQNLAGTLDLGVFSGLDIRDLNIYSALNGVLANPGANGFTNVASACYTGEVDGTPLPPGSLIPPTICANPSGYVFWDYEHPTEAVHAIVASLALGVVLPEPPTWSLMLAIIGVIALTRHRQGSFCLRRLE